MKINNDNIFRQITFAKNRTQPLHGQTLVLLNRVPPAFPEVGAEWIEVAGVYAMFDGIESPLTRTFGLGVCSEITNAELDENEGCGIEAKVRGIW